MPIDWSLANPRNIQQGVMQSFRQGQAVGDAAREMADRREMRAALAALATDPENQNALAAVFTRDPRLGAALMDRADEKAFGRDAATMVAPSQPNALLALGSKPAAPGLNALAPAATFDQAFAPMAQAKPQLAGEAPLADATRAAPDAPEVDLSGLGEPQTEADMAFLRMVRRDPLKALKIQSAIRDNFVDRLQGESEVYALGMAELSRATDQASWDAALQTIGPRAEAVGMDIFKAVPRAYPGRGGVEDLMRRAQAVKDQLDLILREANAEADNARADRNTDSLIETREGRLAETQRVNDGRLANQRRGQDIASRDRRDRPRGGKRERLAEVSSPAEAMKLPSGTKFRVKGTQMVKVRP